MSWELTHDRPIWAQLSDLLRQRIVTGEYPAGGMIPSVRELAAEAGVNPNTMQRALAGLEDSGLLSAQRGTGRFVTQDEPRIAQARQALAEAEVSAFWRKMRRLGFGARELAEMIQTKEETV